MSKRKNRLFYNLRVTEHRDLKGKRDIENRKVKKFKVAVIKLHIVELDPKNPAHVLRDYHTKVRAYQTRYNEGNVIRWSTSYYPKNEVEVKALLQHAIKKNKKTKRSDISAISQMVEGEVTDRYRSFLRKGSKISKSAKFVNVKRTASKVKKANRAVDFHRDLSRLELDYLQIAPAKKRKGRKIVSSPIKLTPKERAAQQKGKFKLTFDEQQAQKKFKPRKITHAEALQKRRMRRKKK